ncbi:MAG: AAA family ATPase [Pseudomonadales bacterium]
MSTIEKAAAKLAAKRAAEASKNPSEQPRNVLADQGMPSAGAARGASAGAGNHLGPMPTPSERLTVGGAPGSVAPASGYTNAPSANVQRPGIRSREGVNFRMPAVPSEAAELDLEALQNMGFLTPNVSRSAQSQEFRKIKRQLLNRIDRRAQAQAHNAQELRSVPSVNSVADGGRSVSASAQRPAPANLVMVSSALAGEGKTHVTTNLALSLAAEVDRAVLLIDGDIAKADLTRNFGLSGRVGLGEVLKNPSAVNEAYLSTNIPRLTMIGAGQYHDNLDELFASELMESFVIAVAEQNPDRIVLFDAPPLLVTTEAAVLARHVSQVLLVVESNRTPKEAVSQALAEVHGHEETSLILNKTSGSGRFAYGYGYGYSNTDTTQEMDVVRTGTHS